MSDGGCWNEFENISLLSNNTNKTIYYGSSYIYNANQFINELIQLNK